MEIEKKVIRFIELSEKFSKTEDEAIGKEKDLLNRFKKRPYGLTYGSISIANSNHSSEEESEETLEVLADRMITKIREFEEYKQLQKDLTEYFKAKQKLNN